MFFILKSLLENILNSYVWGLLNNKQTAFMTNLTPSGGEG